MQPFTTTILPLGSFRRPDPRLNALRSTRAWFGWALSSAQQTEQFLTLTRWSAPLGLFHTLEGYKASQILT